MNEKNENHFLDKYPEMFVRLRDGKPFTKTDRQKHKMLFGLACGDGWFTLIDQLCKQIQHHVKWKNRDGNKMEVHVHQVKEKFGGLRFYVGGADDYVHGLISMAETMSYYICEKCGGTEDVQQTDTSWIRYYCKNCREEEGVEAAKLSLKDEHELIIKKMTKED